MISVIIPLYNKEPTIKRTVDSVLAQTFQDFEIVIVNDGSTDRSVEVVESIGSGKIRVVNQANKGVAAARNRGIKESRYNWLAFLDGDDEWCTQYLSSIYNAIQEDPECIIYCSKYIRIGQHGRSSPIPFRFVPADKGRLGCYYKSSFFGAPIITSSSACLNKSIMEREGLVAPFPIGTKSGEDLDAWVKLALNNEVYFINKQLVVIHTVNHGSLHLSSRLSGELNYTKWMKYSCSSIAKKFWLVLYAFKKICEMFKKIVLVKFPWLYKFYLIGLSKM